MCLLAVRCQPIHRIIFVASFEKIQIHTIAVAIGCFACRSAVCAAKQLAQQKNCYGTSAAD
jgi:hypothetical protein